MEQNTSFAEIWNKLMTCKRIALTLHPSPDGDSLGACTALKYALEREGISVTLISPDALSVNLDKLPYASEVHFGIDISDIIHEQYDAFVFLDYGSLSSFSVKQRGSFTLPENVFSINIDHHAINDRAGTLNYVDSDQPALCSLLVDLFKDRGMKFDAELSSRLLLGICTDSGFFTYDGNPDKALNDAVFLIENGARYLEGILKPVLYSQPLRLKQYFGFLLNNLKFNEDLRCGYSSISLEQCKRFDLNSAEVRLGVNELQFIDECQFVFTLAETEIGIKGSFRSKKGIDVSRFAQALGGGGHKAAASFFLPSMSLAEAEQRVLDTVRKTEIR
ncbi:DHH family phosphoesterase [Candidatus Pacearchaeota archaeon]|nr:DHH family phosphoesterase [Candidatus Pacearchaeota archaeon]